MINRSKNTFIVFVFFAFKEKNMDELIEELLEIMDEECGDYEEEETNKSTIINIYVGGDK